MGIDMSQQIVSALAGSFLGGLLVFLISEVSRAAVRSRRRRYERRMQIVGYMERASALLQLALRENVFKHERPEVGTTPMSSEAWEIRTKYDELTMQALLQFERHEHEVASWAAVEFYAGYQAAIAQVKDLPSDEINGLTIAAEYELPRASALYWWAKGKDRRGPRFASLGVPGDSIRHRFVTPNSDAHVGSMLSAPAGYWAQNSWRKDKKIRDLAEKTTYEDRPDVAGRPPAPA